MRAGLDQLRERLALPFIERLVDLAEHDHSGLASVVDHAVVAREKIAKRGRLE